MRVALALHCELGRDFARAIEHRLAAAELAAARNPRDARPLLAKALELAERLPPDQSAARRAALLIRLGRHDAETAEFAGDVELYARAEQAVSEALVLEPGSVEARTVLGLIHLERGENERAFLDFARALERAPEHAAAWDGLSYLFKNTGLWAASLAAQQRAAALDDRFAHSIRRLSVLIYEGRLDEARDEATALVQRRPKFAHYNYWRGIAAWYSGEHDEARRWIEQAYALDPADPIAQGVLAFVLAAEGGEGEQARARELLLTAEPGAAADGTFTYWIAKVHALLGDAGAALDWIHKAANLGYWDAPWMRKDAALATLHELPDVRRPHRRDRVPPADVPRLRRQRGSGRARPDAVLKQSVLQAGMRPALRKSTNFAGYWPLRRSRALASNASARVTVGRQVTDGSTRPSLSGMKRRPIF